MGFDTLTGCAAHLRGILLATPDGDRPAPQGFDLRHRAGRAFSRRGNGDYIGAGVGQAKRHRAAKTAACAGDHRNPVFKAEQTRHEMFRHTRPCIIATFG